MQSEQHLNQAFSQQLNHSTQRFNSETCFLFWTCVCTPQFLYLCTRLFSVVLAAPSVLNQKLAGSIFKIHIDFDVQLHLDIRTLYNQFFIGFYQQCFRLRPFFYLQKNDLLTQSMLRLIRMLGGGHTKYNCLLLR